MKTLRLTCGAKHPDCRRPSDVCGTLLGDVVVPRGYRVELLGTAARAPSIPDGYAWLRCQRSDCKQWNRFGYFVLPDPAGAVRLIPSPDGAMAKTEQLQDIETAIAACDEKRVRLENRTAAIDDERKAAQAALGRAVADGAGAAAEGEHRAALRELADEESGIISALGVLVDERRQLERRRTDERRAATAASFDKASAEYSRALRELEMTARRVALEQLQPLVAQLPELLGKARAAHAARKQIEHSIGLDVAGGLPGPTAEQAEMETYLAEFLKWARRETLVQGANDAEQRNLEPQRQASRQTA